MVSEHLYYNSVEVRFIDFYKNTLIFWMLMDFVRYIFQSTNSNGWSMSYMTFNLYIWASIQV